MSFEAAELVEPARWQSAGPEGVSGASSLPPAGASGGGRGKGGDAIDPTIALAVADLRAGRNLDRAYSVLHGHFNPILERYFRRAGAPAEVADLAQEVWMRVHEGVARFRDDAPFGGWLFAIARTTLLMRLRAGCAGKRAGRQVPLADAEARGVVPAATPPQAAVLLRAEQLAALRSALASLPDQMRRCHVLRIYQDRSVREIAVLLGVSTGTVKAHLFQARRRLAALLGPRFGPAAGDRPL